MATFTTRSTTGTARARAGRSRETAFTRPRVALHRQGYLVGVLVTLFTAVVAVTALIGLVADRNQSSRLLERDAARNLLVAAHLDVEQGQTQISLAMPAAPTAATRAALPRAVAQLRQGIMEWNRYSALARARNWLPAGATQLTSDLRTLEAGGRADASASGAPTTPSTAGQATMNALARQVGVDFDIVQRSEQAWWTANLSDHQARSASYIKWLLLAAGLALVSTAIASGLLARSAQRRDAELAARDDDLARVATANEFETRLQRALELSSTEDRVFGIVEQALEETVPELSVEMLLADSSRAHFQQLATTGNAANHRCQVDSPAQCPAAQRGEVLTFESSKALDACPYLKDLADPCSAVCVPVSVSGLTVGVVHASGAVGEPPNADRRAALELVARRASDRIGMMRAFSRSELQASTDPLTGLPNRRSLEDAVRRMAANGTPYAVAFGDLDHFKAVNDLHGHGAGDQALRLFARVLRDGLRPADIYGRYGGEEFVIVLPNCDSAEAVQVLERIRAQLAATLANADTPTFTVSFGLALSRIGERFETMVSIADGALLEAKKQGRDRVVIADQEIALIERTLATAAPLA